MLCLVAIGVVFAALAGCGDDEAPSASITKAELIERGDAVCSEAGEKAQSEFAEYAKENEIGKGEEPTAEQLTEVGEEILIPIFRQQADEIEALGAPEGDEARVDAIVEAIEAAIEKAEEDPEEAVQSTPQLFAETDELLDEYGFEVCGQR